MWRFGFAVYTPHDPKVGIIRCAEYVPVEMKAFRDRFSTDNREQV